MLSSESTVKERIEQKGANENEAEEEAIVEGSWLNTIFPFSHFS